MFLTNFGLKYPEIATKENRNIVMLKDGKEVPKGNYEIQEMYCTDPKCDCRKVSFNIIGPNNKIYYLDYGFEKAKYYFKKGFGNEKIAEKMSGLSVNIFNGDYIESEKIFDIMKYVLEDKKYIRRLKKHYKLMKKEVDGYEDPFLFDDNIEGNEEIIFLDDKNFFNFGQQSNLDKKTKKERQKKKNAKKEKKIQKKKKKKK